MNKYGSGSEIKSHIRHVFALMDARLSLRGTISSQNRAAIGARATFDCKHDFAFLRDYLLMS
jgi:hypothetical protein